MHGPLQVRYKSSLWWYDRAALTVVSEADVPREYRYTVYNDKRGVPVTALTSSRFLLVRCQGRAEEAGCNVHNVSLN